jgi:hypothetical protein
MKRASVLSLLVCGVLSLLPGLIGGGSAAAAERPKKMQIACNLWHFADWATDLPFVDAMKTCRPWKAMPADAPLDYRDANANVPADENGYPLEIPFTDGLGGAPQRVVTVTLVELPKDMYPNGKFTLLFEGKGAIRLGWDAGTHSVEGKGGTTKFEFDGKIAGNESKGILVDIPRSEKGDHIRNIRLIMPGFLDTYEKQPFHPLFLEMVKPFCSLRFMDWGGAMDGKKVKWSKRTKKDAFSQQGGMAYEWMIELCNTLNKDPWICCPYLADEEYQRELAKLIQVQLKPGLKVYIEWSNEMWNSFQPELYSYSAAMGSRVLKLDTDWGKANCKYTAYAALRMFKIFDEVFKNDHKRYVKAISVQCGKVATATLEALKDPLVNPDGVKVDAAAVAPYFGFTGKGGDTVETLKQIAASVPGMVSQVKELREQTDKAGVDLISYEGGSATENIAACRHPEMYNIYRDYLDGLAPYLTMFNQYTVCGRDGKWGAKEYVNQPLSETPKYRALVDYINGVPAPKRALEETKKGL